MIQGNAYIVRGLMIQGNDGPIFHIQMIGVDQSLDAKLPPLPCLAIGKKCRNTSRQNSTHNPFLNSIVVLADRQGLFRLSQ
jgi:hypothetical protein